jgi:hypothetical protein
MLAKLNATSDNEIIIYTEAALDDAAILVSYGLAREPNGVISWARDSALHPRHWSTGRKVYDTALIILLELYT